MCEKNVSRSKIVSYNNNVFVKILVTFAYWTWLPHHNSQILVGFVVSLFWDSFQFFFVSIGVYPRLTGIVTDPSKLAVRVGFLEICGFEMMFNARKVCICYSVLLWWKTIFIYHCDWYVIYPRWICYRFGICYEIFASNL